MDAPLPLPSIAPAAPSSITDALGAKSSSASKKGPAFSDVLAQQRPAQQRPGPAADSRPAKNGAKTPAGGKNAGLIADLLEGFIGIATRRGRAAMALYDPVAAVAFVSGLIGWRQARIDVELQATLTRGRTVVEARAEKAHAFNAHFAETVDAEGAKTAILEALRREAAR